MGFRKMQEKLEIKFTSGSKFYKSKFAMVWVVAIRFDFLSSPLYDFREINPHIMRAHYTSYAAVRVAELK